MANLSEAQKQSKETARRNIFKHIGENYLSVIPIVLVVSILYFVHLDAEFTLPVFVAFLISATAIGLGLSLFTAGADLSMTRIGTLVGETLFKKRKMWLIVLMKYYTIRRNPYLGDDYKKWNNYADNVPFGSELVSGTKNESDYLIYRNPAVVSDSADPNTTLIGHAVDSSLLYQAGSSTSTLHNQDSFYTTTGSSSSYADQEMIRNESLYLQGAIVKDEDVTALTNAGFSIKEGTPSYTSFSGYTPVSYSGRKYVTNYMALENVFHTSGCFSLR